ncbi:MAG: M3 family oligoendopeptidase [Anaerolineales bacterium]|nr:M3 family oligoendopeptidase [Anaerolineales bacterium]
MSDNGLPHWDMTTVYPSLESDEFEEGFSKIIKDIDEVVKLFDEHGVGEQEKVVIDGSTVTSFETVLKQYNKVLDELQTMRGYVQSFIATDSENTLAQAKWSILQPKEVQLSLLGTRFSAWIGALDIEALMERSALAHDHEFLLQKAKIQSLHLMSPSEEDLASELGLTGGKAWEKLYGNYTSQIIVSVELEGEIKELPMSAVRNLAFNPDRDVRRRAFEAELAAWEEASLPIAAALNNIKGMVNTLARRRKWESALDIALYNSNIDRRTLDAMMEAAYESFPYFRRYLHAKGRVLGLPALPWYDLFAPVTAEGMEWAYDEAEDFIVEKFSTYSNRLSDLAKRAFKENWIDAEPRKGKRGGAFCVRLRGDESRIMANYQPSFDGVGTLAHELGHAYHNVNLAQRTYLQRITPMTLAETASNFCEIIIRNAFLQEAGPDDQFNILEGSLQDACQVVVDITSRFIFEQEVFEKRGEREVSIDELNELMLNAQRETYADGLDSDFLHPYMWAVKPHYYSTVLSFYNFPYMFGLLFSLGLYAHYLEDEAGFKAGYDELLSSTGLGNAADLAGRFGIEIEEPDFWRASLGIIQSDIERFETLVEERVSDGGKS